MLCRNHAAIKKAFVSWMARAGKTNQGGESAKGQWRHEFLEPGMAPTREVLAVFGQAEIGGGCAEAPAAFLGVFANFFAGILLNVAAFVRRARDFVAVVGEFVGFVRAVGGHAGVSFEIFGAVFLLRWRALIVRV